MRFKVFMLAFFGTLIWWSHGNLFSFLAATFQHQETASTSAEESALKTASIEPVVTEDRGFTATYQPVLKPYAPRIAVPTAHAAVIVDSDSQEILYAEDADEHRQIASLTKLMTAILVIESIKDLDELVTIDEEAVYAEGTRVGCPRSGYCIGERLKVGEQLTARDLLKAALMNSTNDAAIALGKHLGTTQEGFATIMNKRAKELGMMDTHFCTPSGLEPDGHEAECYSTARDVAKMTVQALKYDLIWQFMRLEKEEIVSHDGRYRHEIFNTDELLGQMPNLVGTKTGFTPLAGRSLLAVAKHPELDHRVVAVVLDDQYRWQSVRSMFDWSFQAFEWK